jgi:hypothetical protein
VAAAFNTSHPSLGLSLLLLGRDDKRGNRPRRIDSDSKTFFRLRRVAAAKGEGKKVGGVTFAEEARDRQTHQHLSRLSGVRVGRRRVEIHVETAENNAVGGGGRR